MIRLIWLAGAVVPGLAAVALAPRSSAGSMSEGLTLAERRKFYAAAALGAVALVCLAVFFAVS